MICFRCETAFDDGALRALRSLKDLIFSPCVEGVKANARVEELRHVLDRLIQCEPERQLFLQTETQYFWVNRIDGKKTIKENFMIRRKA